MSDDLNKKIKQITDILSQENLPDNLKELLNMLASSGSKDDTPPRPAESPEPKENKNDRSEQEDSLYMINKVRSVMEGMNGQNDPRVALLNAIKPFLNNRRQKKLNNCVRLLQMSSLTRLLEDNDKGGLSKGD
jgi:hypothetical protein